MKFTFVIILLTLLFLVPTQAPQIPTAEALGSDSILLICYPPSASHQNGPMRKYKIVYQTESILSTEQTLLYVIENSAMYPFTESKDITIPSLQPYTFYIFTLVVFNDAGYSPNVSVSARTDAAGNQIIVINIFL